MIIVTVAVGSSVLLAFACLLVSEIFYSPYAMGLDSGLLARGQNVILLHDFKASPATKVFRQAARSNGNRDEYEEISGKRMSAGEYLVRSGTPCIVRIDPAGDEDACRTDRPIAVKLTGGEYNGMEVAIPREILRKR